MISQDILRVIDANRQRYVDELIGFLQIPSVSTCSQHASDVRKAADWVFNQLRTLGLEAQICQTARHPIVYGCSAHIENRPTVLIYGHYDVQPPDPLEEWLSPPFVPAIRDGCICARGATDDKGQFLTYLKAMEAILAVEKTLPVNVKVLVEGEEEIGSPSMDDYIRGHRRELAADVVVLSDGSQFAPGIPAITYALRGLSYLHIDLQGPSFDLHSGYHGGLIANPIQVLVEILAKLKDPCGRVAIPGFYDDVEPLQQWERDEMSSLAFDEDHLKAYLGVEHLTGEPGYSSMERKSARPTLDVNGIWGGYCGEGAKTIIPARAGAKVSMRLVPRQQSERINRLFCDFVGSLTPPGVRLEITDLCGCDPVLVSRHDAGVRAAAKAIETGFGRAPVFVREGGSIPIVSLFKESLGMESILLLGWGSPDDGAHSPNERFSLDDFHCGIRSIAALLYELQAP
ncbi:MAG TPA: dipeptidase [Syntrophobacteraceae bacterium]|nr:dipeptidase [Syntrophobacteraceae bacterium]